jgi:hypothetical protein
MKSPMLGLAVSTLAFAGSSIYLWTELAEQRARADEVTELTRRLNARIAELEKARDQFEALRLATTTPSGNGAAPQVGTDVTTVTPAESNARPTVTASSTQFIPPERSATHRKMMRTQVRAHNRRIYSDLADQLGLSQEDAARLIDLITDQQVANNTRSFESQPMSPTDMRQHWEQIQRENQRQIAELLGPQKAEEFRKYQESMPARGEVEMIARQLEGSDAPPLKDEQRKRLVAAISEERGRVPMPQFDANSDPASYSKLANEWQADYEERVSSQMRAILDDDQFNTYSEYQQWQREMREQFAASRGAAGLPPVVTPRGNVVYASPGGVAYAIAAPVPAPPPGPEKRQ